MGASETQGCAPRLTHPGDVIPDVVRCAPAWCVLCLTYPMTYKELILAALGEVLVPDTAVPE